MFYLSVITVDVSFNHVLIYIDHHLDDIWMSTDQTLALTADPHKMDPYTMKAVCDQKMSSGFNRLEKARKIVHIYIYIYIFWLDPS